MEFAILGPLEVSEGGRSVQIGGGKQRGLLAFLLLHRNQVVSSDRLIDELWGGEPPATAAKIVQLYVSQLRKVLEDGALRTQAPGYVLEVDPEQLDADRFEQLLGEGRRALSAGDPEGAVSVLRDALRLWHGPPLADFTYEPFAQTAIARLEELHLACLEERIEADLALGRHADVVPELQTLVAQHPLRERLRGQLMLALYQSGRQAEALEVYQDGRRVLGQELGLEPGQALQDLEKQILRHDPATEPPPRVEAPAEGRIAAIVPPSLRRRSVAFLVAGGIFLGAGIAAAVVTVTAGGSRPEPIRNAVAAIDTRTGRVTSYTEAGETPSNVAAGESGVWVLNGDDETVSLIDPKTRRIVKTFSTGGTPTDIAAGEGAVWVGTGTATPEGQIGDVYTASVSRVDPHSELVTRRLELSGPFKKSVDPATYRRFHLPGLSQLAVGAGAVWAINPDTTVSRIDPATGKLAAIVDVVGTTSIAAGKEGVWVVGKGPTVTRIDPRTNRAGQTIGLEASGLAGIAVGAGSVWVTDPIDGLVWRVEPGPGPVTRSIDVGVGVTSIAFGDGVVWATNFIDGSAVRIDPRANSVTARIRVVATPQGIAVGRGTAWVSVAGGTSRGTLPTPACSPIAAGVASEPDVLIASDLPLQGPQRAITRAMADAVGFVLRAHGFKAGKYTIGYQACDDSTPQSGGADFLKCASNAKAYAETAALVGVIGPYNSDCAVVEIPITNRAQAGPVPMLSPANTLPDLTRGGGSWVPRGAPGNHYPTGIRSYVRLAAPDDLLGAGDALLAKQLELRRIYLLKTGQTGYGSALTSGFRRAAGKLGLTITGSGIWNANAEGYAALAGRIGRSGADGVLLGDYGINGGQLIKALRKGLGQRVTLITGDGFLPIPETMKEAGPAAFGVYVTIPGVALDNLGSAGRRFARRFGATQRGGAVQSGTYVPQAAQATEALLQAIARSDGTRPSVLGELRRIQVRGSILGSFRFDRNGDMTPALVTAFRITGQTSSDSTLDRDYRGAVADRMIRVPSRLLG